MAKRKMLTMDGNEAAAHASYAFTEVATIYPITPSSVMPEHVDEWATAGRKNIFGQEVQVTEMQSEAGAAGAYHGSLAAGALTTTFTASQGLLLMIPNLYKVAGEQLPGVFDVSARAVASHALSIFGDHSDIYACRQTGCCMLCESSVQEVMDLTPVAHLAALKGSLPFINFFDGFRTSHEIQKIETWDYADLADMADPEAIRKFREHALNPNHPVERGSAQNPDIFFQVREASNTAYEAMPAIVQEYMDKVNAKIGTDYKLFNYYGAPDATSVIIAMGSVNDTIEETIDYLVQKEGAKVGVVKVRLYRPFSAKALIDAIPDTVKVINVLDRTKEPGAEGEPLYLDVIAALRDSKFKDVRVNGGRYGLGSKDTAPNQIKAVFENTDKKVFTIGIEDDVTGLSLKVGEPLVCTPDGTINCKFWGIGADGTVGANKNSIKIIGNYTENYAQGYFEYDSKKSGGVTISHLRFGSDMIRSPYFINSADFTACHCFPYLEKYDMLKAAKPGSVFLLASPYTAAEVWDHMPDEVEQAIIDKKLKFYVIDAAKIARENGMGTRTNTVLQTAFFKLSGITLKKADGTVLDPIQVLKDYAEKAYSKKGQEVVEMNWKCIEAASAAIEEVKYPAAPAGKLKMPAAVPADAPEFVKKVSAKMIAQKGDTLKVSELPVDGTWPTATTQWEKRNVAAFIPQWDPAACIQCGNCLAICSHAAIRMKVYNDGDLAGAPATFKSAEAKALTKGFGSKVTIQVAPEDCMGCELCVVQCPMKAKGALKMVEQIPLRKTEAENWKFFLNLPEVDPAKLDTRKLLDSQLKRPLFEFSGACAGCGETPYVKLLTQICGDRLLIANATGCSSIYGGNLPTTPYCQRADGRGPAWSNSLFEDNAQFGLGMRVSADKLHGFAMELVDKVIANEKTPAEMKALCEKIKAVNQYDEKGQGVEQMRALVKELKKGCEAGKANGCPICAQLLAVADNLVRKSVWVLGGDGWAYDIGYGGLDHVLASGKNIKILVMDTEVYSNTGGQASKATPTGAIAKFAASGKVQAKKNLGLMQMQYKNVYVAYVSMGTNPAATVKAFNEAENYNGPAIIIAYAHCIEQGLLTKTGPAHQKAAVESVHFPLWTYNPTTGKVKLDSADKSDTVSFAKNAVSKELGENRFKQLIKKIGEEKAMAMLEKSEQGFKENYALLKKLSEM